MITRDINKIKIIIFDLNANWIRPFTLHQAILWFNDKNNYYKYLKMTKFIYLYLKPYKYLFLNILIK